jgi:hypothetical protein
MAGEKEELFASPGATMIESEGGAVVRSAEVMVCGSG